MRNFIEFLTEAETSLRGSLSGADSYKTISHVLRYVVPFLNKDQAENVVNSLGKHVADPQKVLGAHNQIDIAKERDFTHTLAKDHEGHKAGTPVRIIGTQIRDGKVIAQTEKHGDVPLTKIAKPPELKKEKVAKKAWGLEELIAGNLGGLSAGSSKESHDFAYPPTPKEEGKTKKVKGVVKTAGGPAPTHEEVLARGETKGHNGVMGNAKFSWEQGKGWSISHSSPELAAHMAKAHVNGVPIIDYLNNNHGDGVINKGFQATAPQGMARAYLKSINSNMLHIHDLDSDKGTTFTINDELKGKSKMGHLGDSDIDSLDGLIAVGKTQNGKTLGFHRPNQKAMKTYAKLSETDPQNHRSLTNAEHAKEFINDMNTLRNEKKKIATVESPSTMYHPSHGGKSFYGPDEQTLGTA